METFADRTARISRELDIEQALSTLDKHYFDRSKSTRLISGIAVSSRARNSNGISFAAQGVDFSLPTPLLWNHEWTRPLGRVTGIEVWGDTVQFRAEIGNNMPWVDEIWSEIWLQNAAMVSVEGSTLVDPVIDKTFARWRLNEISVVQDGADKGAAIQRCWEKESAVHLNRPNEIVHWELPR